jgi:hypothetical protein
MFRNRRLLVVLIAASTTLNGMLLILNTAWPSRAAVSGMDYKALVSDDDFRKAVKTIVEACRVNVGVDKIHCSKP